MIFVLKYEVRIYLFIFMYYLNFTRRCKTKEKKNTHARKSYVPLIESTLVIYRDKWQAWCWNSVSLTQGCLSAICSWDQQHTHNQKHTTSNTTHLYNHNLETVRKMTKQERYKWALSSTSISPIDFPFVLTQKNEQFYNNRLHYSVFCSLPCSYLSSFSFSAFYCRGWK